MALRQSLDLDLLRTLMYVADEASFTRAAERIGRTQSAVTLQVQKLEALVGHALLVRSKGGPVELTPQGRVVLERARAMLRLNEDIYDALAAETTPARCLRLGVGGFASLFLQRSLDSLREARPDVLVEVQQAKSCQLVTQLKDDAFDLMVIGSRVEPPDWPAIEIWSSPLRWLTSASGDAHLRTPLPLSLWPGECPWRPPWMKACFWWSAPLRALEEAERLYRVVSVADSFQEHFATVLSGEAVAVGVNMVLPPGIRFVTPDEGLPKLPENRLVVLKGQHAMQPLTDLFAEIIAEACLPIWPGGSDR